MSGKARGRKSIFITGANLICDGAITQRVQF